MVPALVLVAAQGLAGGQAAPPAPAAAGSAERPNFSGSWTLARKISDDIQSKIEAATGGSQLSGAGGIGGVGLLPKESTKRDVERLELGDSKVEMVDVLTLVPTRNQLIHGLRIEGGAMEKPLELALAYDKVKP